MMKALPKGLSDSPSIDPSPARRLVSRSTQSLTGIRFWRLHQRVLAAFPEMPAGLQIVSRTPLTATTPAHR